MYMFMLWMVYGDDVKISLVYHALVNLSLVQVSRCMNRDKRVCYKHVIVKTRYAYFN
jgi:hypothetical protein